MPETTPIALANLTTLQVGGTPARMFEARTRAELVDALQEAWRLEDPWFVLGGGSNLLVADGDLPHTVIRVLNEGIERLADPAPGVARVRVEAGHNWDAFVQYTVAEGLAGIEALSGIPGTVGAVPIQNVGAYGQEVVQTLVSVELLDEGETEPATVPAEELGLGVRTSFLKRHEGEEPVRPAVVLAATFDLRIVGHEAVALGPGQLRSALRLGDGEDLSLAQIRERVLAIRASKGMVLDPADADTQSAGSFFQNPIIPEAQARALPAECPQFPVQPDSGTAVVIPLVHYSGELPPLITEPLEVKVAAGWLIEHSGLGKGFRLGASRAGLSTKHALALTNRGGASADELAELARFVRARVHAEFGLLLHPEPVLVGVEI